VFSKVSAFKSNHAPSHNNNDTFLQERFGTFGAAKYVANWQHGMAAAFADTGKWLN